MGHSTLIGDMIHSCSNENVASAAVMCIGREFSERVEVAARAQDTTIGPFVSDLVREFAAHADQQELTILQRLAANSDQPILRVLRHLVEQSWRDGAPSQPRPLSCLDRFRRRTAVARRRSFPRRALWILVGPERPSRRARGTAPDQTTGSASSSDARLQKSKDHVRCGVELRNGEPHMFAIRTVMQITARCAIAAPLIGVVHHAAIAQPSLWKECGTQYQSAKTANQLDGQSWRQFVEACRARVTKRSTAVSSEGADAQTDILKACGSQYRAAKDSSELNGKGWIEFLKACRVRGGELPSRARDHAAATPSAPTIVSLSSEPAPPVSVASPLTPPTTNSEPPTGDSTRSDPTQAGAASEHAVDKVASQNLTGEKYRQKKCASQWKAHKIELKKADPTLNWSRYWIDCDKRLKVSGR